ncbi:efflux RND transporter periplasmic adaptor subunit [Aquibium sp. A9E412]|uniref:efflux RND transporter periplasmic adaptor subunit n=1 Tax=Aquibium sp. A9E412 TaxID=2976767 RepID=UPI0025B15D28|nr:efflux RND transporter periplasmic adaptor subunit [Aquibium sp. A9E412]MDN2568342.1 efflux RND transporter periplasmic adaptor subunit [Aquibium sp. A9E412]
MILRFVIAIVLLALVGGGLVGFNVFRDQMIAQFFENMPVEPLPVSVVEAEANAWQPTLQTIGTVNASRGVDLTVEAAGIVKRIGFESNEKVEEGQVLLQLDDEVQRADLEAARTKLELDELALERNRELRERGVGTSASLETAQAAAQSSRAQFERASAVVEQRQVRAPFSGTIGLPRVDLGAYVAPGTTVTTLQDIDTMRVDFSVSEQQLPDVFIGQALHVRAAGVDAVFDGEIVGIDPRVDPASRMADVRGLIGNAGGRLTPGQFVRIEIDLEREDDVIALPETTVISSLYGDYVYRVQPREDDPETLEVRQVFVETGRRSDELIELRSGVAPGDRIVATGQNRLSNGAPVTVKQTAPETAAR